MALTITKQTNGYFLFESNNQKNGSSRPEVRQRNNMIEFYDFKKELIEGPIVYSEVTVKSDAETEVAGLDSAEAVIDALYSLGMLYVAP